MIITFLSVAIVVMIIINIVLGNVLYEKPTEEGYFNNVRNTNRARKKTIAPDPKYVLVISIFMGVLLGSYWGFIAIANERNLIVTIASILLIVNYLIEISRTITLHEDNIVLSKFFFLDKKIPAEEVAGMYIYSYNKKFLKNHAYTSKLVITTNKNKNIKFTLSSIDNKAVLNMMSENFGINSYKMYISKKDNYGDKKNENL